ncbi:uncharacterized protein LOC6729166 [Drosophila simulans]|uniref:GD18420 n=1 Tax=Drosophila simulans TaxID=7240 RepID=B4R0R7_DROSI|nr:uncharacterized protein LOC6729166 [Drosophila simulans]EDX13990.1 GD18420 [Drosophila simulans]KMZ05208.1 uncharacterized protein Dsimw501_GD18420 [Drosophila simulans]
MIRVTTCLLVFVFFVLYIHQNHAATKVLYEFHIREANQQRDEMGEFKDTSEESDAEPELIITGKRTSSYVFPAKENNYVYVETANYVADNNGYHVKYNITLDTVELDRRLSGQALKTTAG